MLAFSDFSNLGVDYEIYQKKKGNDGNNTGRTPLLPKPWPEKYPSCAPNSGDFRPSTQIGHNVASNRSVF